MPAKAVQKAVVTTLIEWQDKFMSVVFSSGDTMEQKLPETIELAYIPDQFTLREPVQQGTHRFFSAYTKGEDYFNVRIWCMENQPQINMDSENTTVCVLRFNGCEAIWGISEKGINTLAWSENNFVYQVSGTIDLKTLIQIAENIKM